MVAVDVPDLRLTLITFYDNAVVGSLAARIWGTAALFSLLIVVSMLLGCAIAMMLFDRPFNWAWPDADRTGHYAIGIAVCLVAMLILVFARAVLDVVWLRLLMLATPGFVIVLLEVVAPLAGWEGSSISCVGSFPCSGQSRHMRRQSLRARSAPVD